MHDKLIPILAKKRQEIAQLEQQMRDNPRGDLAKVMQGQGGIYKRKSLQTVLQHKSYVQVIAEIKRRSPSKGELAAIDDPISLAENYVKGGAAAISVLTETTSFGGSLADLHQVHALLAGSTVPVLRKDFLLAPIQIAESIVAGADAILLIVNILGEEFPKMLKYANDLKIDALVEVHTVEEAKMAVAAGAEIIGVNNRNLHTFDVDTRLALNLVKYIPDTVVRIAESGIVEPALAKEYYAAGYDAVLVGETLVKSGAPTEWIRACK